MEQCNIELSHPNKVYVLVGCLKQSLNFVRHKKHVMGQHQSQCCLCKHVRIFIWFPLGLFYTDHLLEWEEGVASLSGVRLDGCSPGAAFISVMFDLFGWLSSMRIFRESLSSNNPRSRCDASVLQSPTSNVTAWRSSSINVPRARRWYIVVCWQQQLADMVIKGIQHTSPCVTVNTRQQVVSDWGSSVRLPHLVEFTSTFGPKFHVNIPLPHPQIESVQDC